MDESSADTQWTHNWGILLRTARQIAGFSLAELSQRTRLSKGYLSKLESGHASARNPSRATLAALARALPSFGPLAHTLEPATPQAVALTYEAPVMPSSLGPDGDVSALTRLGWRELELLVALLTLEHAALTIPLTVVVLARSVTKPLPLVRETAESLVTQHVVEWVPPVRPGGAPALRTAAGLEMRLGVRGIGDALVLAAVLLAQGPVQRLRGPAQSDER